MPTPDDRPALVEAGPPFEHPHEEGTTVGHRCFCHTRLRRVALLKRVRGTEDNWKHYIREHDSYAMSEAVLDAIMSFGAEGVLIQESDTGTVYEYHIGAWMDADRLPESRSSDPNVHAPISDAFAVHEGLGPEVWAHYKAEDAEALGADFQTGAELR